MYGGLVTFVKKKIHFECIYHVFILSKIILKKRTSNVFILPKRIKTREQVLQDVFYPSNERERVEPAARCLPLDHLV